MVDPYNPAAFVRFTPKRSRAIWFKHQPIPACAGKTAYDLVGEGRANVVVTYLKAVRSDVYA